MRARGIVAEAIANLRHRPPLPMIALVLAIAAIVCGTALAADSAVELDNGEILAGRDVLVATATSEAGLSAVACQGLVEVPSVVAAGGPYMGSASDALATQGGQELPVTLVSPGALRVWIGPASPISTAVGSELAKTSGMTAGGLLVYGPGAPMVLRSVLPSSVPVSALQSTVVIPMVLERPLSECWISFAPGRRATVKAAVGSAFAGTPVGIGPFVDAAQDVLSAREYWGQYVELRSWAIAGAVAAAVLAVDLVFRRRDMGVYLIGGASRRAVVGILCVEAALPTLVLVPLASAWGILGARLAAGPLPPRAVSSALAYGGAAWLVFLSLAVLAAALLSRVNPFAVLKET